MTMPRRQQPKRDFNPYKKDLDGQTIIPGLEWWDRYDPHAELPGQLVLDFGDGQEQESPGSVVRK